MECGEYAQSEDGASSRTTKSGAAQLCRQGQESRWESCLVNVHQYWSTVSSVSKESLVALDVAPHRARPSRNAGCQRTRTEVERPGCSCRRHARKSPSSRHRTRRTLNVRLIESEQKSYRPQRASPPKQLPPQLVVNLVLSTTSFSTTMLSVESSTADVSWGLASCSIHGSRQTQISDDDTSATTNCAQRAYEIPMATDLFPCRSIVSRLVTLLTGARQD